MPGISGYFGVLPGHEPLMTLNAKGGIVTVLSENDANEEQRFLIYDGITHVIDNVLTVACQYGVNVAEIDACALEKEALRLRSESNLADGDGSEK